MAAAIRHYPENDAGIEAAIKIAADRTNEQDFGDYLSSMPRGDMWGRAAYILTTTGIGAGIGALAGSPAGGIGAGPGAGIGAASGLVFGAVTCAAYTYASSFIAWRNSQSKKVIDDTFAYFRTYAKEIAAVPSQNFECAISSEVCHDPVKTPYTNDVYERSIIEAWIDKNGTCPMTRKPLTKEQLRASACTYATINSLCQRVIKNNAKTLKLSPDQVKGLKRLQEDFEINLRGFFRQEITHLSEQVEKGQCTYQEAAAQVQRFANAAEPVNKPLAAAAAASSNGPSSNGPSAAPIANPVANVAKSSKDSKSND